VFDSAQRNLIQRHTPFELWEDSAIGVEGWIGGFGLLDGWMDGLVVCWACLMADMKFHLLREPFL
jgi:hypothetical protein